MKANGLTRSVLEAVVFVLLVYCNSSLDWLGVRQ